jgi:hypothetical protein
VEAIQGWHVLDAELPESTCLHEVSL